MKTPLRGADGQTGQAIKILIWLGPGKLSR